MELIIFQLAVLIFSVMIHEVAHGAVALALGDPTAKYLGRLTLNPIKHIDPMGSIIVPLFLILISSFSGGGGFIFGWAKPVPYNPYNLRNKRWGTALVGFAGVGVNLLLALFFSFLIRTSSIWGRGLGDAVGPLISFFILIVFINVLLAVFNLFPVPPLDGSRVFGALFPRFGLWMEQAFARYGMFLFILFLFVAIQIIGPLTFLLFSV